MSNIDQKTVSSFGDEWQAYNQSEISQVELKQQFKKYFSIFPWHKLPDNAVGFDLGCGSGRWAKFVAAKAKIKKLYCVDAAKKALNVAQQNLKQHNNCEFIHTSVDSLPFAANSMDFAYSIGVLHHVPSTLNGIKDCVDKLKKGAPFLVYLYYSFENRPFWFRIIWRVSNIFRKIICKLPFTIKSLVCKFIAASVYLPLAKLSKILEIMGFAVGNIPLSFYRKHSFYTMQTDALDRFGTPLEQRFSKQEIKKMLEESGLTNIEFRDSEPFHCAIGTKL